MALERAGLKASDIGMVLCGSCSPDELFPAEANRVAEKVGIDGPCIDVFSACSTFASQLYFLEAMRPEKLPDYVMLVSPENNTRVVDYNDRSACVLWGDASTAAIVSPRIPGKWKVLETTLRGDPGGAEKVKASRFGHFIQQGADVQKFAIKRTQELYEALRGTGEPPTFVGHQANLRMLEVVARRCEITEDKHLYNVDIRGNVGGAGAPSVLSEHWESPKLGNELALCVVGSGLTWAGIKMQRT
jgi:3-oxoacyl-[acyl-carrier-protein] synthase-3